jgi:hypothetical protein
MSQIEEKARGLVEAIEHPIEAAKELEHEAEVGESARTPAIALAGVTLFVGVLFVLLMAIAMTLYFVYGGK